MEEGQEHPGAWGQPLVVGQTKVEIKPTQPEQTQQEDPTGKSTLSILTWNVQDLGSEVKKKGAGSQHQQYVTRSLQHFVKTNSPDVVVLQEVTDCSLVKQALDGWKCVDSVVAAAVENKIANVVLGNVLLYNAKVFSASHENRVLSERHSTERAAERKDSTGMTLAEHHKGKDSTGCDWGAYNECNMHSDMPKATSVRLKLLQGQWAPSLLLAFAGGIRVVDVHLFAGGSAQGLQDIQRAHRRAFQMRSLLALVDYWNSMDGSAIPPTTVYAGDFNTRDKTEMQGVIAPASNYNVNLWCPADGGWCDKVDSRHSTSTTRQNVKQFLDHVAIDIRPQPKPNSGLPFQARSHILSQLGTKKEQSDHSPLFVEFQVTPGVTWPPLEFQVPQKPMVMDQDNFPTLG